MESVSAAQVFKMLAMITQEWEYAKEWLCELDGKAGDGDLGITMELGAQAVEKLLPDLQEEDIGSLLEKCGSAFNKAAPSTMGTLIAASFLCAGKAAKGRWELTPKDLIELAHKVIEEIMARGKASLGDKTILDALVPAVEAMERSINAGGALKEAATAAACAAVNGVEATVGMKARVGRASWLGDRSCGYPDGGAVVCQIVVQTVADYINTI